MSGLKEDRKAFETSPARAKLFQHGGSQAVRLPKAFRFEGSEVSVLEPVKQRKHRTPEEWAAFWAEIDNNGGADFPDRDQPPMQERDWDR